MDSHSVEEEHQKTEKPVWGKASTAAGAGDLDGDDRDDDAEVNGLPPGNSGQTEEDPDANC